MCGKNLIPEVSFERVVTGRWLPFAACAPGDLAGWAPRDLYETDAWVASHHDPDEEQFFRRSYFSAVRRNVVHVCPVGRRKLRSDERKDAPDHNATESIRHHD